MQLCVPASLVHAYIAFTETIIHKLIISALKAVINLLCIPTL